MRKIALNIIFFSMPVLLPVSIFYFLPEAEFEKENHLEIDRVEVKLKTIKQKQKSVPKKKVVKRRKYKKSKRGKIVKNILHKNTQQTLQPKHNVKDPIHTSLKNDKRGFQSDLPLKADEDTKPSNEWSEEKVQKVANKVKTDLLNWREEHLKEKEVGRNKDLELKNDKNKETGEGPGLWIGRIINKHGEGLPEQALSLESFYSYSDAVGSPDVLFTDYEGKFRIPNIDPENDNELFLYHYQVGVQQLDRHSFMKGEIYEKEYTVNVEGEETATITLRLQSENGFDIRNGWVATSPVFSDEVFLALLEQGGSGMAIPSEESVTLTDLVPWQPIDLFYSNELSQQIHLGRYKLKSGENRNLGVIRISENIMLPSEFSGVVINNDGIGVEGLRIEAMYEDGSLVTRTDTLEDGSFILEKLVMRRIINIFADDKNGNRIKILKDHLIETPYQSGEVYQWNPQRLFTILVMSDDKPIESARVNLYTSDDKGQGRKTNQLGKIEFTGLNTDEVYHLMIYHPFYEKIVRTEFKPDLNQGTEKIQLKPRPGVKVKLHGPDWETGLHIRAWVGISNDGMIHPDYMPGNEYGEVMNQPELLFEVPPKEKYWIYVGGMPIPWASKLYGPFDPKNNEIINLELERAKPLSLDISDTETVPYEWHLVIYAKDAHSEELCQLQSAVVRGAHSSNYYLGKGTYRFRMQHTDYKKVEFDYKHDGENAELYLKLKKNGTIPITRWICKNVLGIG